MTSRAAGGLVALVLLAPAAGAGERLERRLAAMGTDLSIAVEATDRATALAASERAVVALEVAERRLSTWRSDSELARLNASPPGRPVALSVELGAELTAARRCSEETGGAFDPAVGALVAAWGLRTGGRLPSPEELRQALAASRLSDLELLEPEVRGGAPAALRRRAGLVLEEGAFGKGAGLDAALAALAGVPGVERAELDLGGQVAVAGEGTDWRVALADPRDRARPMVALAFGRGSVATSSDGVRRFSAGGRTFGHLLDPRSGEPAADFGSLTVWAPDALSADCLSTGLFVLGPEEAIAWAGRHPGVEALALVEQPGGRLDALASPGLRGRIEALSKQVTIRFGSSAGTVAAAGDRGAPP